MSIDEIVHIQSMWLIRYIGYLLITPLKNTDWISCYAHSVKLYALRSILNFIENSETTQIWIIFGEYISKFVIHFCKKLNLGISNHIIGIKLKLSVIHKRQDIFRNLSTYLYRLWRATECFPKMVAMSVLSSFNWRPKWKEKHI